MASNVESTRLELVPEGSQVDPVAPANSPYYKNENSNPLSVAWKLC